ncbi:MAG: hypothetical protein AAF495_24490 [Pseudomonadota bacterium]
MYAAFAGLALAAGVFSHGAVAAPKCTDLGLAGLLAHCNSEELPPITMASGKPLAEAPLKLQSGVYYEIEIVADGSAELALAGPEFFRAIWVDEIVINDLEVRPLGVDSFEFDDEGTIELSFIAIKPGRYYLKIPGSKGETQRVDITIE